MIVTIFNAGWGKASNATRYLFSEKDSSGKIRNPPVALYKGDRELTEKLIDLSPNKTFKYTSGAIAFRDNEKPTDEQIDEVIKSFREVFAPGMGEDRVNMLWVRHEDKGNTELHFLVVMNDLKSMRQFSISPTFRKKDGTYEKNRHSMQLEKDFSAYWNDKLGYDQIVEDPLRANFNQFEKKTRRGQKRAQTKERLADEIAKRIRTGKINNRVELVHFLNQKAFKVTRQGSDYLSILLPGRAKPMRFKGGCFAKDADYREIVRQADIAKSKTRLSTKEFNQVVSRINGAIQYRIDFNKKRYTLKKRIPKLKAPYSTQAKSKATNELTNAALKAKQEMRPNKANSSMPQSSTSSKPSHNSSTSIPSGSANESLMVGIGSLEDKIYALGVKLSQVPTEQRAQIQAQIAVLKIQLERMQHQLAEARKAELNKGGQSKPKFK